MSFKNSVNSLKSVAKQTSDDFKNIVSEFSSSWSGPAYNKFSVSMNLIGSSLNAINGHFEIYSAVGELILAIELINSRLKTLNLYKGKLNETSEELDSEITTLKDKKKSLIKQANDLLGEIKYSIIGEDTITSASKIATSNPSDAINEIIKNSTVNPLMNPTSMSDIDFGPGQYMADEDWAVSPYFSKEEFKCKCGGRYCNGYPIGVEKNLVELLTKLRFYYGSDVKIMSGIRCQKYNDSLKGSAKNSRHIKGRAVDIKISGVSAAQIHNLVRTNPELKKYYNYSYYGTPNMGTSCHVDVKEYKDCKREK